MEKGMTLRREKIEIGRAIKEPLYGKERNCSCECPAIVMNIKMTRPAYLNRYTKDRCL